MSNDFPTFGDFIDKKVLNRKEVKSRLWDDVESSKDDFVTFDEYYSNKHNISKSDVKSRLWDNIETSNTDFITFDEYLKDRIFDKAGQIPKHIEEGIRKMKNVKGYLSIQDPEFLEKSKIEYYKALEEEDKKRRLQIELLRSSKRKEPAVSEGLSVLSLGTSTIGNCKIG